MQDCRMSLMHDFEENLISLFSVADIQRITDALTFALNNYEITERCTDVVPYEDANEKILKRYIACLSLDGKSEKTINAYKQTIGKLAQSSLRPLTELSTYEIRYFLACEKERGISNRSLENYRSNLSAFYTWLTTEEVINKNPMLSIKPIAYKNEIKLAFSDIEIDALRSACISDKERALIEALLSTGVRVEELSSMKVVDIDFDKLEVYVRNGKGNKERKTYTTPLASMYIRKYLESRKETNGVWLFYNRNHEQLQTNGIRKILKTIARRANVSNCHPHKFRRSFATGLAKKGMDVREIQKLLGHVNINTTLRYICTDEDNVKASYRKYIG